MPERLRISRKTLKSNIGTAKISGLITPIQVLNFSFATKKVKKIAVGEKYCAKFQVFCESRHWRGLRWIRLPVRGTQTGNFFKPS
ncbi:MAG: hypothetical protein F7O42_05670 [Opitutae bacterium]|nr:hypothetical protein [Opitutae bacterium]